jgi:hypothetical protein
MKLKSKLERFSLITCLAFVSKTKTYKSEALERCFTRAGYSLTCKQKNRLDMPANEKHSSFLQTLMDYSQKFLQHWALLSMSQFLFVPNEEQSKLEGFS